MYMLYIQLLHTYYTMTFDLFGRKLSVFVLSDIPSVFNGKAVVSAFKTIIYGIYYLWTSYICQHSLKQYY